MRPACGGDDDVPPAFGLRAGDRVSRRVTLTQHKWVILRECRGGRGETKITPTCFKDGQVNDFNQLEATLIGIHRGDDSRAFRHFDNRGLDQLRLAWVHLSNDAGIARPGMGEYLRIRKRVYRALGQNEPVISGIRP